MSPRKTICLAAIALAGAAHADQYTCESGTVSREARAAAPSRHTVGVLADKSRNTCEFEISGEKIDRNASASTTGGGGSSSSSSSSSASRSERSQRTIQEARQSQFQNYRGLNTELSQFAPLIFGTTEFPPDIVNRFGRSSLESGLRDCFRDLTTTRREFRSVSAGGGAMFRCGSTGTRSSMTIDLVGIVAFEVPKVYFSFRMSDRDQYILFIPLVP